MGDGLGSTKQYTISPRQTLQAKIRCLIDSLVLPINGAISAEPQEALLVVSIV